MRKHAREPVGQDFAVVTARPPFLYELGPDRAQQELDDIQAAPKALGSR